MSIKISRVCLFFQKSRAHPQAWFLKTILFMQEVHAKIVLVITAYNLTEDDDIQITFIVVIENKSI
jgi:hypothetical protein